MRRRLLTVLVFLVVATVLALGTRIATLSRIVVAPSGTRVTLILPIEFS